MRDSFSHVASKHLNNSKIMEPIYVDNLLVVNLAYSEDS